MLMYKKMFFETLHFARKLSKGDKELLRFTLKTFRYGFERGWSKADSRVFRYEQSK